MQNLDPKSPGRGPCRAESGSRFCVAQAHQNIIKVNECVWEMQNLDPKSPGRDPCRAESGSRFCVAKASQNIIIVSESVWETQSLDPKSPGRDPCRISIACSRGPPLGASVILSCNGS
jgi:hypothetical protein